MRTVFIDSSYRTGYCIWMPGTSKRPRCESFSVIDATSYAINSSEPPPPLLPPDASMVNNVSNMPASNDTHDTAAAPSRDVETLS